MRCSNCGFENRPEARFCKQCGQALPQSDQPPEAQTAPPTPTPPSGATCPACGATAKPGARFCPRCGNPLAAESTPSPPPPAPGPSAAEDTEPSISTSQPYATPPASPPPAETPAYAQPPAQPLPPATPPAPKSGLPRWLWWVGGIVVFLCIAAVVVGALVLRPKLFGKAEEPTATPPPPAVEATATPGPPAEPAATEAPTVAPPTESPPAAPAPEGTGAPAFDAEISISTSVAEVRANELLTVTVTIVNTGQVAFGNLRYQLLGTWEPYLRATTDEVVEHESEVTPNQSDTATFVLEAVQPGQAEFRANVTVKTREDQPSVKPVQSEQTMVISIVE